MNLSGQNMTDAGLAQLEGLTQIQKLVRATSAPAPNADAPKSVDPTAPPAAAPARIVQEALPSEPRADRQSGLFNRDPPAPTSSRPRGFRGPVFATNPPADLPVLSGDVRSSIASGRATPLVVGRYQVVSHSGALILLDTATGAYYTRNGHVWENLAPPIDPNAAVPEPQLSID